MNSPCATSSWRGLRSFLLKSFTDEDAQSFYLAGDWQINDRTAMQARGYFTRFDEVTNGFLLPSGAPPQSGNLFELLSKVDASFSRIQGERKFIQDGAEWAPSACGGISRLQNDNGADIDFESVRAQGRVSLANRATVTLGLRFDHHSIFGPAVSPKAGLNLRVTDYWRIRASYGRGFRAPDLGRLFYRFLNPTNFYQVTGNPMGAGAQVKRKWRRGRLPASRLQPDETKIVKQIRLPRRPSIDRKVSAASGSERGSRHQRNFGRPRSLPLVVLIRKRRAARQRDGIW